MSNAVEASRSALALEASGINFQAGGRLLLEGVSCRIEPGKVVALVGPNGAGKTTLLRVLSGELTPHAGSVTLNGEGIDQYSATRLALHRAVLPQSSTLAFPFLVEDVVLMGRAPHVQGHETARDIQIAREAMQNVEVEHLVGRNYLTLSGGEKQRVHLARVLAQLLGAPEPHYLLLDEPIANLDLAHQCQLMRLLRKQARAGAGIFIILHDLNFAARYADEVIILAKGKKVASGLPTEVLNEALLREVFAIETHIFRGFDASQPSSFYIVPMD